MPTRNEKKANTTKASRKRKGTTPDAGSTTSAKAEAETVTSPTVLAGRNRDSTRTDGSR